MTTDGADPVERIAESDLAALVELQMRRAAQAGSAHVRAPKRFRSHLLEVAQRAERIAWRLCDIVPEPLAPDPVALFVAGAWHDGGKIRCGDDFHEICSAIDVIDHGLEWGLVRGPVPAAAAVLRRAALAIPPSFAAYEQWQPTYTPTTRTRAEFEAAYRHIGAGLFPGRDGAELERLLLLPHSLDALVLMYSDMGLGDDATASLGAFAEAFERRWRDIEHRSRSDDPALFAILPSVKPRVHAGCALVHAFLATGFDGEALARFRSRYAAPTAGERV